MVTRKTNRHIPGYYSSCYRMRELITASQNGHLASAFCWAVCLSRNVPPAQRLHYIASTFFVNTGGSKMHNMSAMSCAALAGHHPLVEAFLFSVIVSKCAKQKRYLRHWSRKVLTIPEWLDLLGCFPVGDFDSTDFQTCVDSASYMITESTLTRRYDLAFVLGSLRRIFCRYCLSSKLDGAIRTLEVYLKKTCAPEERFWQKPKATRPSLTVEDDYDLTYRPDEDESYGDDASDDEDEPVDGSVPDDTVVDENESVEETLSVVSNLTLPTLDDLATPQTDTSGVQGYTPTNDASSEQDDWVDEFSLTSSFSMLEFSSTGDNTSNWEVLSEESSAVLVEKTPYRDALRLGSAPAGMSTMPRLKKSASRQRGKPRVLKEIVEESAEFDSDFVMEGVKQSHGGKPSLRFKGNQKYPKCHGRGRGGW